MIFPGLNKPFLLLVIIFTSFLLFTSFLFEETSTNEAILTIKLTDNFKDGWKLCSESDKVYIYERWIKAKDDHYYRELKGEMRVECGFDQAVNTITAHEHLIKWMDGIKENKLIKRYSASSWMIYTQFSLPWPFENREMFTVNQLKPIKPGSYSQINISSIDTIVKPRHGITRLKNYKASWNIMRLDVKTIWLNYTVSADNPPPVPRFIQDPILRKTLHQNLVSLRAYLEK